MDSKVSAYLSYEIRRSPESVLLDELLEKSDIQDLFESFYDLVKLPFAIIDLDGNVLLSSRWQRICTDFHRAHPATFERCSASAQHLRSQLQSGKRYVRQVCPNGLIDYAAPICIEEQHVANLVLGQFLTERPNEDQFRRQAGEFGFDAPAYLASLREVPIVAPGKIPAVLRLLLRMTRLITHLAVDRQRARNIQEDYERLFNNMGSAMMVVEVTFDDAGYPRDHRCLRANPAFEKLTGVSVENEVGKTRNDMAITWPPDVLDRLYRVATSGEPIQYERFNSSLNRYFETHVFSPRPGQFVHVFNDTTERRLGEEKLRQVNRQLLAIRACHEFLVRAEDEQALLAGICTIICKHGGYRMAWVGYAEHDAERSVRPVAWTGSDDGYLSEVTITWADDEHGRGPTGTAIRTGEVVYAQNFEADSNVTPWRAAARRHGFRASIALPIKHRESGVVMGALAIYSAAENPFIPEEIVLLSDFAGDLAYGIDVLRTRAARKHAEDDLEKMLNDTVITMAKIVELRDPYTAGHQLRVAALADAIATEMQFDTRRIDRLRMAAIIHDIGKVSIPADTLNKSSVLTDAELRLVQTHSQRGYEIVRNMNLVPEIAQAVWQHHERWDGSGYPKGLKGNELQMEARIIAVADVVEAMSAHRPYRPALGIDAALEEIVNNAGKLYAPEVARACVAVFREGRFQFPTDKPSTGLV